MATAPRRDVGSTQATAGAAAEEDEAPINDSFLDGITGGNDEGVEILQALFPNTRISVRQDTTPSYSSPPSAGRTPQKFGTPNVRPNSNAGDSFSGRSNQDQADVLGGTLGRSTQSGGKGGQSYGNGAAPDQRRVQDRRKGKGV